MTLRILSCLALLVLFSGCSTLKQQWYDFTAYYNTFYNANRYFESGLEQDRNARGPFEQNRLIRIHPAPSGQGAGDFAVAIEKSAEVLRRHNRSSHVDAAVMLIGRSYYYREEYFAAREQFRDLYRTTGNPELRQEALIWEGRTYLELGLYSEGIRLLEEAIGAADAWSLLSPDGFPAIHEWQPVRLAELRAVLAQLYAFQGELQMAGLQLLQALGDLDGHELAPRAYIHYAQLMERVGNYDQAASAYGLVTRMRADFDLEVEAGLRRAVVLMRQGEHDQALDALRRMDREDRYRDRRAAIQLEIARVELAMGLVDEAEERLKQILSDDRLRPDPPTRARAYYEMAELQREERQAYMEAAAWYDSAATLQVDDFRLPEDWDAAEQAEVWGEYASIRSGIDRIQQMLDLGQLSEEQLDERLREMREEQGDRPPETGRQVWQMEPDPAFQAAEETDEPAGEGRYGYLNIRNRTLVERSMNQFRLVWGDPPLTDHWRRSQARSGLAGMLPGGGGLIGFTDPRQTHAPPAGEADALPFDLAELPQTEEERTQMRRTLHDHHYRLGNLYLIRLDMPERAKDRFLTVWQDGLPGETLHAAVYALAELALGEGNLDRAEEWADRLFEIAPDGRHAERLAARLGREQPRTDPSGELRQMDPGGELTAARQLEQVREEIVRLREDELFRSKQQIWYGMDETARSNETLAPVLKTLYPYGGEEWDRIRRELETIVEQTGDSPAGRQARLLLEELERYSHLITERPAADPAPLP